MMIELNAPQARTLREIADREIDDCTVMLPPNVVCIEPESWPPKIVLTDAGQEALASYETAHA